MSELLLHLRMQGAGSCSSTPMGPALEAPPTLPAPATQQMQLGQQGDSMAPLQHLAAQTALKLPRGVAPRTHNTLQGCLEALERLQLQPQGQQSSGHLTGSGDESSFASSAGVGERMASEVAHLGAQLLQGPALCISSSVLGTGRHRSVYLGTWRGMPVAVGLQSLSVEASSEAGDEVEGPEQVARERTLRRAALALSMNHTHVVATLHEVHAAAPTATAQAPETQHGQKRGGHWQLCLVEVRCQAGVPGLVGPQHNLNRSASTSEMR